MVRTRYIEEIFAETAFFVGELSIMTMETGIKKEAERDCAYIPPEFIGNAIRKQQEQEDKDTGGEDGQRFMIFMNGVPGLHQKHRPRHHGEECRLFGMIYRVIDKRDKQHTTHAMAR